MRTTIRQFAKIKTNTLGFTLVELLVAMLITTIVCAGIFSGYTNQQKAQLAQKQVVEMQQNSRAGIYFMTNEIRMAGYDPSRTAGAGIVNAGNGSDSLNRLIFTLSAENDGDDNSTIDNDADGSVNIGDGVVDEVGELKYIEYYLYDANPKGVATMDLGRREGAQLRAIVENIQTLQFEYLDTNGAVIALPIAASNLTNIRSVRVTITAIRDLNEKDYVNSNGRTLITTVKCRNLGL